MAPHTVPVAIDDPVNARILAVSEDRVEGFHTQPFHEIARLAGSGLPVAYTNLFWGGRSQIKPSEIAPIEYDRRCAQEGVDSASLRA